MEGTNKNILTAFTIAAITILTVYILPLIPNFLKPVQPDDIVGFQLAFIIIFLLVNVILIGIPAWIHWAYVKDYSKIKNVWFFAIFGGITGALLGEVAVKGIQEIILIIPYTILMLIYAQFYKRFTWWKVALTSYFGGIFVENIINRSPIQIPTLVWIAFFTYPYFVTKIWENKHKISIKSILYDFKWAILASIILLSTILYFGIEGPVVFFGTVLPFIVYIIYRSTGNKASFAEVLYRLKWHFLAAVILVILAVRLGSTSGRMSPPLILFGAVLPFIVAILYKIIRRK